MSYDIQAAFGKRTKLNCLNTIEICIPSGNVRMMSEVYFIFGIYLEYFFGQNKYIFDSVVCCNVEFGLQPFQRNFGSVKHFTFRSFDIRFYICNAFTL